MTRVVLLFGGRSAEHEVSCVSARHVLAALDPERYDVVPVGITREGRWVLAEAAARAEALEAVGADVDPFAVLAPAAPDETVVAFPLLHGPFGEDGTMQGLLELAAVPYVGSGVLASALAMDKAMAKRVLAGAGLPQAGWLAVRPDGADTGLADTVEALLGWPTFVKPANLGSSVGVSKVAGPGGLAPAVALAGSYDEVVVVEEAIGGRELECGVLGNVDPKASVPGEVVPGREFYDYEDKYVEASARLLVPAPVSAATAAEVARLALAAYAALGCEGMARVDLFYEEGGRGLLVNEVNTIPGFTPISMYPKLWEASGLAYPALVDRLVALALERHARRAGRVGRAR